MNTSKALLERARAATLSPLLREAGWLIMAKVAQGVFSLLATLVVARHLGPNDFGGLALALTTAAIVSGAATLGLEQIASRELASTPMLLPVRSLFVLRTAGGALGTVVMLALGMSALFPPAVSALLVILACVPLAQCGDFAEWQLVAGGLGRRVAMVSMLMGPLAAGFRLWLAWRGAALEWFAWAAVLEWLLRSLLLWLVLPRRATAAASATGRFRTHAAALLRESTPLLLASIAVFMYMRIDQFMIGAMLGQSQVGLYSAVVSLSEVPLVLPTMLLRVALPAMARAADEAAADARLERLMRSCFWLHLAGAAVLALVALPLVRLLYGADYVGSVHAFRVLVLTAPFVALGVLSSAWLVLRRRTGHALRRTLLGLATNVALNFVLIPAWGIAGAAVATLLAQVVATYAADAGNPETRELFRIKSRAIFPRWSRAA